MTLQECKKLFDTKTIKMGRYYTLVYAETENGYTKTTTTKVRFVNYYNIASVKASGKTQNTNQPNPNIQVIIPHVLTFNSNTQNYLLHCYKTPNGKAKHMYQDPNGNTIDQATYEMAVPPKKKYPNNSPIFQKKLQAVISIG